MPEPGSVLPFRLTVTFVPVAALLPPSCRVRPPSSEKLVVLNVAPPCAIVVPAPLCLPPDSVDRPETVSVPAAVEQPGRFHQCAGGESNRQSQRAAIDRQAAGIAEARIDRCLATAEDRIRHGDARCAVQRVGAAAELKRARTGIACADVGSDA